MKFLSKVAVFAVALALAALPMAACVLPGSAMTAAEQDCCKKMAGQCGHAGMTKSHSCCQIAAAPSNLHALKTSVPQVADFDFMASHRLPVATHLIPALTAESATFQLSKLHDPPGLETLATTILRI